MKWFNDIREASVGAFSSMLFYYVLKPAPLDIDWRIGLGITIIWSYLLYSGFNGPRKSNLQNMQFFRSAAVTFVLSCAMAIIFKLATMNVITSEQVFGSSAMVGVWLGLPLALLFDMKNFDNVLGQYNAYFVKKRGK
jgi:hypothetical protein